jgi:hypothetical protein
MGLACSAALSGATARAAEGEAPADDLAAVEARINQIELQLAEAKSMVEATSGKSAKAPVGLPDRFKQTELQTALRRAFKQVNPGAELIDLDCTEYPCIAIGTGIATGQLGALKATLALQPYQQDDVSLFVWEERVGVIATPKGDLARGGEGEQRILTRFHQMATAKTSKGS